MKSKQLEKSIEKKLELPFKDCISKLKTTLTKEETLTELKPHLTTEELKFIATKL